MRSYAQNQKADLKGLPRANKQSKEMTVAAMGLYKLYWINISCIKS